MSLSRRMLFGIGIGRTSAASVETQAVQMLQLAHHTGEVQDGVPSVQLFGLASVPVQGCDHIVIYAEGDRSKGIAIASNDQRCRPKNMAGGEVRLYDNAGNYVYLKGGTIVAINAATEVDVNIGGSPVMKVTSSGVAITGKLTTTGDVVAGTVSLQHHVNTGVQSGGSNTGPPAS